MGILKKMSVYTMIIAVALSMVFLGKMETYATDEQLTYDDNPGEIVTGWPDETEEPSAIPDLTLDDENTETTTVSSETKSKTDAKGKKESVQKVKITKATKKKSAKKLVIRIKKVKGAKGYQIRIYTKKKNAKKNKKAIIKKTIKKNKKKLIVKSKKLNNKEKLFVRVRGFKTEKNGRKKFGKWSKIKKVKIKK